MQSNSRQRTLFPKLKPYFSLLLGILVIGLCIGLLASSNQLHLLLNAKWSIIAVSIIPMLCIYYLSGLQLAKCLKYAGNIDLSHSEMLILPITMNFWSFIIPIKGGLLYSLIYLKIKHRIQIASGLSISLYIYFISLTLCGLLGIYIYFTSNTSNLWILVISLLFTLSVPLIFILFFCLKQRNLNAKETTLAYLYKGFLDQMDSLVVLINNARLSIYLFALNIIHLIMVVIWYYVIVYISEIDISLIYLVLVALVSKLSLIFKFTPGNIGVEQAIAGLALGAVGSDAGLGVLISTTALVTSLAIIIPIGIVHSCIFSKDISIKLIDTLQNRTT